MTWKITISRRTIAWTPKETITVEAPTLAKALDKLLRDPKLTAASLYAESIPV
jgi:hypothetical protein